MSSREAYSSPALIFGEAHLSVTSSEGIGKLAMGMPGSIYSDSFKDRGEFIGLTDPITKALMGSEIGYLLDGLRSGGLVALTLSGLPRDPDLPPAPLDGGKPKGKNSFVSEAVAVGLAKAIGYPSIILGEKKEELVHQITPVAGKETSQSNEGQVMLRFHQDLAPNAELPHMPYHLAMPTWLILTGLQKGTGTTPTSIASIDEAMRHLSPRSFDILRESRFVTNPPDSFLRAMPDAARNLPVHPVLFDHDGHLEAAFDTSSDVRPIDGPADVEAISAISEFDRALETIKREVFIEPGTSVIFNNRRVIHGRGAVAKEQSLGQKRWIQRVYVFELERMVKIAIQSLRPLQAGGGLLRISDGVEPVADRLMEMANN